jgi:hypothetical protein
MRFVRSLATSAGPSRADRIGGPAFLARHGADRFEEAGWSELLEEATRLSGAKTYSAAVNQALEDLVRRARAPDPRAARLGELGGGSRRDAA